MLSLVSDGAGVAAAAAAAAGGRVWGLLGDTPLADVTTNSLFQSSSSPFHSRPLGTFDTQS